VGFAYLWIKAFWMKYYIIAGEASGDLHAANLIKSLKKEDANTSIRAWGGDRMKAQGATLVKHYRDLAFMGFWEVAKNLLTIFINIRFCKEDILAFQPDAIILIDYPGFNLRIAKWAKSQKIPVHYYISPQVWAWKENRVALMKKVIDYLYVILPFEKTFFENKHQLAVDFVGHPLLDEIAQFDAGDAEIFRTTHKLPKDKPIVALLPGSRAQEVSKMVRIMSDTAKEFPEYCFVIGVAPHLNETLFENLGLHIVKNDTYTLLSHAHAALVTSGTATLETALFEVPQIVCYKTSALSYAIGKQVVKLPYISLVNLILDQMVVPERIQRNCNPNQLSSDLSEILHGSVRTAQLEAYKVLKTKLGGSGASDQTAKLISQRTHA
jgi:lipid-A-disaccharide synthase